MDQVFKQVGELGRFQILLQILLCVTLVPTTMTVLLPYFTQYNPSWKCIVNSTVCSLDDVMKPGHDNYNARCGMPREEWQYTKPKGYSIVTQFDLFCDKEIYSYIATSMTFVFWAIGAVVLGWIADTRGRIKVILISCLAVIGIGFISSFSSTFAMYATCRAMIGFFIPGPLVQLFIVAVEFSTTRYRPLLSLLLGCSFTIGLVLLGVLAYFIREWKVLIMICTAPYVFIFPCYVFVPESVRWLHAHGKQEETLHVLRKIAKINKIVVDEINLPPLEMDTSKIRSNPLDIFRPSHIAISTFIQAYGWFVNGMVYYGISLAADDLGGSMYRDYIVASLIEFPAMATAIYTCKRFGRKKTVSIPMFIASVACVVVSLFPTATKTSHWTNLRVTLGMIGKFCVAASFNSIYLWSSELYPTVTRAVGMGFLQITCRIGAAMAPWITKWLKVVHIVLPFAIMGGLTFISSILLLWLPETAFRTMEEIHQPTEKKKCTDEELDFI